MTATMERTLEKPAQQDGWLNGTRKMLIDGRWVEAESGETFATLNPATGETLAQIPAGDRADVEQAVRAARRAFESGAWPI